MEYDYTANYLILSFVLFLIGSAGFIIRKNAIVVFMCLEIMLNAVNLAFVALSRHVGNFEGEAIVFFVMVVAAAEAAVGLAVVLAIFRTRKSIDTTEASELKL